MLNIKKIASILGVIIGLIATANVSMASVHDSNQVMTNNGQRIATCSLLPNTQTGIREFGLLKNVEDSGYPFVTLTIEFPERGFTEYFTLNLEEVNTVNAQTLSNAVGKYLSFEYNSDFANVLLDLRLKGKSLIFEGEVEDLAADTQTITGILSNAAEATTGDIPGELYIQTEEEITLKFPFFITPEIVRANGKTVVGYYEQRTVNTILSLEIKN